MYYAGLSVESQRTEIVDSIY